MTALRVAICLVGRRVASRAPSVARSSAARVPPPSYAAPAFRQFHKTQWAAAGPAETFLDRGTVTERVITVVKNFEKVDPTKVVPGAKFKEDLALDSLDAVELVMAVEDEFAIEIPDAEADKILSVQDAVDFVVSHPMAK